MALSEIREYRFNDFKPEHLRVNYDLFNDDVPKHYLEGKIHPKEIDIFDQFKV